MKVDPVKLETLVVLSYRLSPKAKTIREQVEALKDSTHKIASVRDEELGDNSVFLMSVQQGMVYQDSRVEDVFASIELAKAHVDGEIIRPWSLEAEQCPEEDETPDPLAFGEDILRFMEMSVEDSRKEYLDEFESHISERRC